MLQGETSTTPASQALGSDASLSPCTLVAQGFMAQVYEWRSGTVLKLYREGRDPRAVKREFDTVVALHAAGLRVPAAHELVSIDGRQGIVFERIMGKSMFLQVRAQPWRLFAAVCELADLHLAIHSHAAPPGFPSLKERIAQGIAAAVVPDHDRALALHQLDTLPDGDSLCHGDFHPDNVLLSSAGWQIIDWSRASRGHPIGDVAMTSRLFQTAKLPPWSPWYAHALLRLFRRGIHRTYLQSYFRRRSNFEAAIREWQFPLAIAAQGWQEKTEVQKLRDRRGHFTS